MRFNHSSGMPQNKRMRGGAQGVAVRPPREPDDLMKESFDGPPPPVELFLEIGLALAVTLAVVFLVQSAL